MAALRFADVKQHAAGRWLPLLEQLAPDLSEAIKQTPKHVKCPVHGGTDGFRLYEDADQVGGGVCNSCGAFRDGFALLGWLNGWDNSQTLKEVAGVLGLVGHGLDRPPLPVSKPKPNPNSGKEIESRNNSARQALRRVYRQLLPVESAEVEVKPLLSYLVGRGLGELVLVGLPQNIHFHPNLDYWEPDNGKPVKRGSFPAMVAAVHSPAGEVVTLHRTYLQTNGDKAAVASPKKLMTAVERGASHGAAIRLYEATKELYLAEGIETALAVRLATGRPVWATISAYGLESVELPNSVERVFIMADLDRSGRGKQAALKLAGRLESEGRTVSIHLPTDPIEEGKKSRDWLDVLNHKEVSS